MVVAEWIQKSTETNIQRNEFKLIGRICIMQEDNEQKHMPTQQMTLLGGKVCS